MRNFNKTLIFGGLLSLVLKVLTMPAPPAYAQTDSSCNIAEKIIADASQIRGLKVKGKVPCQIHGKELVKKYMLDTIATKLPPKRLTLEGKAYKTIGLIPEQFEYEKGIVDLYVSQLGGYYDPEKKHYIMAGWLPTIMQPMIASHELTHALQDQYYNLSNLIDAKTLTNDQLLARSALIEGDATAVMLDYTRQKAGQGPIEKETDVNNFLLQNVLGASLVSGMGGVPSAISMIMLFPYNSGLRFVHHFMREGSYSATDKIFAQLPRSTEEILHPEKYSNPTPDFINVPEAELRPFEYSKIAPAFNDVLGEFTIAAMLGNFLDDKSQASKAAAGWGGDRIVEYENGNQMYLVWKTHWDTDADAREFFVAFRELLRKRFPQKFLAEEFPNWEVVSEGRKFKFAITGKDVRLDVVTEEGIATRPAIAAGK